MKRKIQFLSILMTMAILLTSMLFAVPAFAEGEEATGWDGTAATAFASGSGTETDPYLISSAAELAYLAAYTNGKNTTEGVYFRVADGIKEIDLNNKTWTPIGNADAARFKGIFDGNNVVIKNLSLNGITSAQVGLFAMVEGATIKNVTVYAKITELNAKNTLIGGLVGHVVFKDQTSNAGCTFSNCNVYADFSVSSSADCYLGAAFGRIGGASTLDNINTYGMISVTSDATKEIDVGGIVGRVFGKTGDPIFRNCTNYATVTVSRTQGTTTIAGGIVGATYRKATTDAKTSTLTNCVNYGAVSVETKGAARAGGIIGDMGRSSSSAPDALTLQSCVNLGDVTAQGSSNQAGSLVGMAEGEALTVEACFSATETPAIASLGKCTVNSKTSVDDGLSGCYVGGISLETLTGARVRIDTTEDGTSGLRFDSKIAKTVYDAIAGMSGVEVELGTVIAPTENLVAVAAARDKIAALEKESTAAAPTYIKVAAKAGAWVNEQYQSESGENYDENANYFTGAVGKILETNYNRAYSAVAYLTVTVGDWSFTFYANDGVAADGAMNADRSRTVAYVGYMAHEDGTKTPGTYTDAQMTILKKYADAYNK